MIGDHQVAKLRLEMDEYRLVCEMLPVAVDRVPLLGDVLMELAGIFAPLVDVAEGGLIHAPVLDLPLAMEIRAGEHPVIDLQP